MTVKSNISELKKRIDDTYLGLIKIGDGSEKSKELERMEAKEREVEKQLRSEEAGFLLQ